MKLENFHQKRIFTSNIDFVVKQLLKGEPVIFPTDTLYGILADAFNKKAVERVYQIKNRNLQKPYIILLPDIEYINQFSVDLSSLETKLLKIEGITLVLNLKKPERFTYLHRGTGTLAFRIPKKGYIKALLNRIKIPLIAPSANPEGRPPAKNITQAIKYFKREIHVYFDKEKIKAGLPSTILKVCKGNIVVLREGKVKKENIKISTE